MPGAKTRLRMLQINCRGSYIKDPLHPWSKRRALLLKVVREEAPSIITFQECSDQQRTDILKGLGPTWQAYYQHGKVGVAWDSAKWSRDNYRWWDMRNGPAAERRHRAVHLKSKKTGRTLWVSSSHFGVHFPGQAGWRKKQAGFVVSHLRSIKAVNVLIGGDFNDKPSADKPGVRQEFRKHGYRDIRSSMPPARIVNVRANTHTGYKATKMHGEWLDDIFASKPMRCYYAKVVLTGQSTDHNALLAKYEF